MKTIIIIIILAGASVFYAQQPYSVPFSSSGNSIDLTISNTSEIPIKEIKVKVTGLPGWIQFTQDEVDIAELKGKAEKEVSFIFSVDKVAPVGKEETLRFLITGSAEGSWTKELKIAVAAPKEYSLFQNYPNPFNPLTTISYQLSKQSRVSLKIYNSIGEEVSNLIDNIQEAGFYEPRWNASAFASGVYLFQLHAKGIDGEDFVQRKKMMLVK